MKHITLLLILLSSWVVASETKEIILNNEPIQIKMKVGEEIMLVFPMTVVDIDIDPKTYEKMTTFLKPNGTALFTANNPFNKSRAIVTTNDGDVHLIDIETADSPTADIINFITPKQAKERVQKKIIAKSGVPNNLPPFLKERYNTGLTPTNAVPKKPTYKQMAQYALRHFTGPSHLIGNDVNAVKIKTKTPNMRLLRIWQDRVRFKLLQQWQSGEYFITAIKVFNISNETLAFDPRSIRGRYLYVGSLHPILDRKGTVNDETVWVFISEQPFNVAIKQ